MKDPLKREMVLEIPVAPDAGIRLKLTVDVPSSGAPVINMAQATALLEALELRAVEFLSNKEFVRRRRGRPRSPELS